MDTRILAPTIYIPSDVIEKEMEKCRMKRQQENQGPMNPTRRSTEMRIRTTALIVATGILAACATAKYSTSPDISLSGDASIAWGPAPAVFPAGAQLAVLEGDPSKAQEFTVRLRMPSGYRIPPHTHPTDENVTVVSGAFKVGMGTTFNDATMKQLGLGGFVTAPANMAHYAEAVGETVVQVHAMGPFTLTYVGAATAGR